VSDQCSDLAVYLLGRSDDRINGREHIYIENIHHSKDPAYEREFAANYQKYFDRLDEVLKASEDKAASQPAEAGKKEKNESK
jgi:phosphate:Na+ symporter